MMLLGMGSRQRGPQAITFDYTITNDADWGTIPAELLSGGGMIGVEPGTYTSKTLTSINPSATLTFRGTDANDKPVLDRLLFNGASNISFHGIHINTAATPGGTLFAPSIANTAAIRFDGTNSNLTFTDCNVYAIYLDLITEVSFWDPLPYTQCGLINRSTGTTTNLTFDNCVFDGGMKPFNEGGHAGVNTSLYFGSWSSNVTITNCTIQNAWTGIYFSCSGFTCTNNTFDGRQVDGIVLQNNGGHCENGVIANNHFMNHYGDPGNLHMDHIQVQPQNNSFYVRNIDIYGNTASAGNLRMAQPDPTVTRTFTTYSTSFSVTTAMHGQESRLTPSGNMTVTLPSAAGSAGRQYCFRYTSGSGNVTFALDGSDTYEGGLPTLDAVSEWATFVSDGTSEWKRLRPGYRTWFLLRNTSQTLGAIENQFVVNIDASAGNVDLTLPDNGNQTYAIRRIDFSSNTARVLTTGGDTITINGNTVSEINFVPGYSIDITGNGAGTWTATEDEVSNQGIFGNAHASGFYENIRVYGNITYTTNVAFRLEQNVPGLRVYNNTFLRPYWDDRNSDGIIGRFEGSGLQQCDIDVRGTTAWSFNNFTVGGTITNAGSQQSRTLNDDQLYISNTTDLPASITSRFNGSTKSNYRPTTRTEVIDSALAKVSGPLDGTLIGAAGTTYTNGFYNWSTGQVNASLLPAPSLLFSDPLDGAAISQDADVTLTFNQLVEAGTGSVTIRNVTDGVDHEVFNVATGTGGSGGTITFSGQTVTINPNSAMTSGKSFALRVDSGAIVGQYGKPFAAISNDTTLNWTTNTNPGSFATVVVDSDRLNRASTLSGISGTRQRFLTGFRGFRTGGATLGYIIELDGTRDFRIQWTNTGEIRFNAGTSQWRIPNVGALGSPQSTYLCSVDLTQPTIEAGVRFYRDGILIPTSTFTFVTWNSGTDVTFASTVANTIFNGATSSNAWHGQFSYLWFDMPASLPDLSLASERAKFTPSLIGANGEGPTGTSPLIYMTGNAAAWNAATNLGTGGTFTATGTFADA